MLSLLQNAFVFIQQEREQIVKYHTSSANVLDLLCSLDNVLSVDI